MKLTNAFWKAVEENDVRKLRIMLKDSLLIDLSFEGFNEMLQAASSVEGLYDKHDGKELIEDPNAWNEEYMDRLMVQVVRNFSHERLEHLKKVVRYLNPVPQEKGVDNGSSGKERESSTVFTNRHDKSNYQNRTQNAKNYRGVKIAGGAVIGGLVGAGAGSLFSMSGAVMLSAVVIGAAVGGTAVMVLTEKE